MGKSLGLGKLFGSGASAPAAAPPDTGFDLGGGGGGGGGGGFEPPESSTPTWPGGDA